jgi:hypothetical protein
MTDAVSTEAPAELDQALPVDETAGFSDLIAPAPEQPDAAPVDAAELAGDEAEDAQPPAEEPAVPVPGTLRARILDALADADEPLTVARILQELPHVSRNTCEGGLRRTLAAGEIERVAPGTYRLAPAKPPGPSEPAPASPPNPATAPEHAAAEAARARDAERKRAQRRKDAEAAAAARAAADQELHVQLLADTCGNHSPELAAGGDVSAIRAAMQLVDLDTILTAIQARHDPRLSWPTPEPLQTWRDPALLQKIAQLFTRLLVPRLVGEWSKAKAPPKPVERAEPQASPAERPSILRGYEAGGVPIGEDEDPGDGA